MTKSIKEKERLQLIRNHKKDLSKPFSSQCIKVKITYESPSRSHYNKQIKFARSFINEFQHFVGTSLNQNMPRLLTNIANVLKIYEFEVIVKSYYDVPYHNPNPTNNLFTINFELRHKSMRIGTIDFNAMEEKLQLRIPYKYNSYFHKISVNDLSNISKSLYTLDRDKVYTPLIFNTIARSNIKSQSIVFESEQTSPTSSNILKLNNILSLFFKDERFIPMACKDVTSFNIIYYLGKHPKVLLIANYSFLSPNRNLHNGTIKSLLHQLDDVNESLALNLLSETNVIPSCVEYPNGSISEDILCEIFSQASIMGY